MTEITSLEEARSLKRWEQAQDPSEHEPIDVLRVAMRDVVEFTPDHVVVIFGKIDEEGIGVTRYYQGGTFNVYAQDGLVNAARNLLGV